MERKALARVEIKDADKGTVAAVFSTLDAIDKDGDVTLKGAFTDGAPIAISAYGHSSWKGGLPVGKGHIREMKSEAVMEGRFFLDTASGRDTFTVVKEMSADDGPGQDWSYGLLDVKASRGEFDGKQVRFIESVNVPEVSPTLVGAGVNTRTLDVKHLKQPNSEIAQALRNVGRERWGSDDAYVWTADYDLDESWAVFEISEDGEAERLVRVAFTRDGDAITLGSDESDVERTVGYAPKSLKFTEHAATVLTDVDALITRASEVMALRAAKGKTISDGSRDLLAHLDRDLKRLAELIDAPTSPAAADDWASALDLLAASASLQGVKP